MNLRLETPSIGRGDDSTITPTRESITDNITISTQDSLNCLSPSNDDMAISPTRRNFERIRRSFKTESAATLSLRKGSFPISEDNFSGKDTKSLSRNSIDEIQAFGLDFRKLEENHITLNDLVVDGSKVTCKDATESHQLLLEKITTLPFIEEVMKDTDQKTREAIHFIYGNFNEYYDEEQTVGQGCSGIVKKCVHKPSGLPFAVKIIQTMGDEERLLLEINQFKHRKSLFHKYIVNHFDLYIDLSKNKVYSVMEYVDAPDLQKHIEEYGCFDEIIAGCIFRQLLLAVQYLHSNGVCHRDLNLKNILATKGILAYPDRDLIAIVSFIKDGKMTRILDFDVSKFKKDGKKYSALSMENMKMWTLTGTLNFKAPEFFDVNYTEAVDLWGLGVVLYGMLTGHLPFEASNTEDLKKEITSGKFNTSCEEWKKLSKEAQDLITALLQTDYKKRLTPFEALAHPWIFKTSPSDSSETSSDHGLEELCSPVRLRKQSATKNSLKLEKKSLFSEGQTNKEKNT